MSKKVVELQTFERKANEAAVQLLEDLLKMAKEGRVTDFLAIYEIEGSLERMWTPCVDLPRLIGWLFSITVDQTMRMHRWMPVGPDSDPDRDPKPGAG